MLNLRERRSDSLYIEGVWHSLADGGPMTSVATARRELVVWSDEGVTHVAVRGPETAPSQVDVPAGFEAFGIVLAHGAVLRPLPAVGLVDGVATCPIGTRGFVLGGGEWEVPRVDSAEDLVAALVHADLLTRDPLVDDVLAGGSPPPSSRVESNRTVERRVRAATGLSRGTIRRIERAQQAAVLLGEGARPIDVVTRLGFHDHPHLARSLRRWIGHHATWLREPDAALSLPYKVDLLHGP